jgi:hypothetical protein
MKTYFIHFSIQTRRKFKNQPRVPSLPSVKYATIVHKISEANPFLSLQWYASFREVVGSLKLGAVFLEVSKYLWTIVGTGLPRVLWQEWEQKFCCNSLYIS